MEITIKEEDQFGLLADWLSNESTEVRAFIDGGDFGDTPTAASVEACIRSLRDRTFVSPVGKYDMCRCFFAHAGRQEDAPCRVGHVAVGRYAPFDPACGGHQGVALYLYVRPEFRGKGCGTQLVSMAVEAAKDNVPDILVLVHVDNHRAKKFYASCGFHNTGKTREKPGGLMEVWLRS